MISFATDRTEPTSPSFPDVILQPAGIWSHSPMSQDFPIRFQTSATGLLIVVSNVNVW